MANYNYSTPQTVTQVPGTRITPNEAQAVVQQAAYQVFQKKQKQRTEQYDNAYNAWKAGKITDEAFLSAVKNISARADTANERDNWESIIATAEHEVLLNKINTDSTLVEARVTSGSLTASGGADELMGLAEMAAKAGDEYTSAKLQLAAAQLRGVGGGGSGSKGSGGSGSASDSAVLNEDQQITKDNLLNSVEEIKNKLWFKDIPYLTMEELSAETDENGRFIENPYAYALVGTDEAGNTIRIGAAGYIGELLEEFNKTADELGMKGATPEVIATLYGKKTGNDLFIDLNKALGWDPAGTAKSGTGNTIESIDDMNNQAYAYMNDPEHYVATYDPTTDTYGQSHTLLIENDPSYLKVPLGEDNVFYVKGYGKEDSAAQMSEEELDAKLLELGAKAEDIELKVGDIEGKKKMLEGLGYNIETPTFYKSVLPVGGEMREIGWNTLDNTVSIPGLDINNMPMTKYLEQTNLIRQQEELNQSVQEAQQTMEQIPESFTEMAARLYPDTVDKMSQGTDTEALQPTIPGKPLQQTLNTSQLQQASSPQTTNNPQTTAPIESLNSQQSLKVNRNIKTPNLSVVKDTRNKSLGMAGIPRLPIESLT